MSTLSPTTKRTLAREFLLLVGVLLVAALVSGGAWVRNVVLQRHVEGLLAKVSLMQDSVKVMQQLALWRPTDETIEALEHAKPRRIAVALRNAHVTGNVESVRFWSYEHHRRQAGALTNGIISDNEPYAEYGGTPIDDPFLKPHPSVVAARRRLPQLGTGLKELRMEAEATEAKLSGPKIQRRSLLVALVLLMLLYPVRFLVLGVRWSLRVLRKDSTREPE